MQQDSSSSIGQGKAVNRSKSLLLIVAALTLAACAAHKAQRPAPKPAPVVHPTPQTAPGPTKHPALPASEKGTVNAPPAKDRNDLLAAAEVGYYIDVLQGRLQQSLDPGIIVSRDGQSIVLDLSRRLTFADADAAALDDASRDKLAQVARVLTEYHSTVVLVRVNASDEERASLMLAGQRAQAVVRCLVQSGVSEKRIAIAVPSVDPRAHQPYVEVRLDPLVRAPDNR
jgi:outer membrane protein OmpA-like peptidoglycan-associated protein